MRRVLIATLILCLITFSIGEILQAEIPASDYSMKYKWLPYHRAIVAPERYQIKHPEVIVIPIGKRGAFTYTEREGYIDWKRYAERVNSKNLIMQNKDKNASWGRKYTELMKKYARNYQDYLTGEWQKFHTHGKRWLRTQLHKLFPKHFVGASKAHRMEIRIISFWKRVSLLFVDGKEWAKWYGKKFFGSEKALFRIGVCAVIIVIIFYFTGWVIPVLPLAYTERYVDDVAGDDGGTGEIGDPWQTMANLAGAHAQYRYHLKAGGTFTMAGNALALNLSGTEAEPGTVTIWGTGDYPILDNVSIEIDPNASYCTLEYLHFYTHENRVAHAPWIKDCQYTVIQHCELEDRDTYWAAGITFYAGDYSYSQVIDVEVSYATGVGIEFIGPGGSDYCVGDSITVTYSGNDALTHHEGENASQALGSYNVYHDCIINQAGIDGFDVTSGDHGSIYDCEVHNCGESGIFFDDMSTYCSVYRCLFDTYPGGWEYITWCSGNHTVWGNVFIGTANGRAMIRFFRNSEEHQTNTGNKIYKNTFIYGGNGDAIIRISDTLGDGTTPALGTIDVSYNIFSTNTGTMTTNMYQFDQSTYRANNANFTADYNLYDSINSYSFAVSDYGTSRNWTWWTATAGHDAHGAVDDPVFMAAGNYHIDDTSPAHGMGPGGVTYIFSIDGYSTATAAGAYEGEADYTPGDPPTVTTNAATDIASFSATVNGTITANGSSSPITRGFYVNTLASTLGATNWSENGTFTTEAFDHSFTGLSEATTYYFRAYATNGEGTSTNATWLNFTTDTPPPSAAAGLKLNNVLLRWN